MFLQVPTSLRIGTLKTILCETDNLFLALTSKSCAKLMLHSGSRFKVKVRSHRIVLKILLVKSYLHLKSLAWKQDCPVSSKLQRHKVEQGHSRKFLWSSTSYV